MGDFACVKVLVGGDVWRRKGGIGVSQVLGNLVCGLFVYYKPLWALWIGRDINLISK